MWSEKQDVVWSNKFKWLHTICFEGRNLNPKHMIKILSKKSYCPQEMEKEQHDNHQCDVESCQWPTAPRSVSAVTVWAGLWQIRPGPGLSGRTVTELSFSNWCACLSFLFSFCVSFGVMLSTNNTYLVLSQKLIFSNFKSYSHTVGFEDLESRALIYTSVPPMVLKLLS